MAEEEGKVEAGAGRASESIDLNIKNLLILFFVFVLVWILARYASNKYPNVFAGLAG